MPWEVALEKAERPKKKKVAALGIRCSGHGRCASCCHPRPAQHPGGRVLWAGQQSNCCRGADNASGLKQTPSGGRTNRIGSRSAGGLPSDIWDLGILFYLLILTNLCASLLGPLPLFFCFFFLIGPHSWHIVAPRLGVELELQLPAYTPAQATWDPSRLYNLHHSSWQHRIPDPLSEARDRPCILMVPSGIRFGCITKGTPRTA